MPIPSPNENEKEREFISRCMGDKVMNKDYPDQKQRAAICYTKWKNKDKKESNSSVIHSMNKPIEIDFSESLAATTTTCDACGASLGRSYAYKAGAMSFHLSDGEDEYGHPKSKEHHVCGEDCARDLFNKRKK
jgi:hypothetical protein